MKDNIVGMKEYFILQYKMTNRKFKDFGLEPIFGYLLILAGFIGLSIFLFYKTEFAQYIYILISLTLISKLSEIRRNDFLKFCFNDKQYKIIRIIENLIVSIPFLAFLIYKQIFIGSIILAVTTIIFGMSIFKTSINFTIPTPFYKKPFEFTVGFRNTFFLFPIAYILTIIAISVGNFNLGIFSLLLVFLITLSYYPQPENEYYVWSFTLTPKQFIHEKVKIAVMYTSIISLPIVLSLSLFYYANIDVLMAIYFVGCAFLITIISAKYSAYPNEMNLPEGFLIALSIFFPPLLLFCAPYFYIKSIKRIEHYLTW